MYIRTGYRYSIFWEESSGCLFYLEVLIKIKFEEKINAVGFQFQLKTKHQMNLWIILKKKYHCNVGKYYHEVIIINYGNYF